MHVHLGKSKKDKSKLDKSEQFVTLSESNSTKAYFYQVLYFSCHLIPLKEPSSLGLSLGMQSLRSRSMLRKQRRKHLISSGVRYVVSTRHVHNLKTSILMKVINHASVFRRNSRILDELDVTIAFANLASEMNFVRPVLHDR
jgi:hypothetical protein